ncbi:unnamed protein product [Brassica napus]|uniref:(rape) hypothetical protein n=1 Tax=Brassica napus TaxID=3708 RepID=A0A817BFR4_BRANA|nr:unnamed protein product [Brassica napus]
MSPFRQICVRSSTLTRPLSPPTDASPSQVTSSMPLKPKTFTSSSSTFTNRRSAEKDAAKLASQHLLNEDTYHATDLRKLVCQNKTRCKMILNEFIDKIEMECVYETVQVEMGHVFVSSLVLNGTCYKGECGKSKKEAEQLAAILSLLGNHLYILLNMKRPMGHLFLYVSVLLTNEYC